MVDFPAASSPTNTTCRRGEAEKAERTAPMALPSPVKFKRLILEALGAAEKNPSWFLALYNFKTAFILQTTWRIYRSPPPLKARLNNKL